MPRIPTLLSLCLFTLLLTTPTLAQTPPASQPASQPAPKPADPKLVAAANRFAAKTYTDPAGQKLLYRLFSPDLKPGQKYPLVLFLHGAGGRGNDNLTQLTDASGVAMLFANPANQTQYPAFVLAPQCPQKAQWVNVPWKDDTHTLPKEPSANLRMVNELLQSMLADKNLPIDPSRIYLTGISMGGFGTWDLLARHPETFAAAAPVCGGADENTAPTLVAAKIPLWVFHGDSDNAVKTLRSRNMVAALEKAGGKPTYTEYPKTGHSCWTKAYNDPKLFAWLFAQKRP